MEGVGCGAHRPAGARGPALPKDGPDHIISYKALAAKARGLYDEDVRLFVCSSVCLSPETRINLAALRPSPPT